MFILRAPAPRTIADRVAIILHKACVVAANASIGHVALGGKAVPAPVAHLIIEYLKRVVRRFAWLAERAANGTLSPPRPRPLPAEGAEPPQRKPRPKPLIRMGGAAWICRHVFGVAVYGQQLCALLDREDMQALVALDPRFAAVLRPVLAALGAHPRAGQLPEPVARRRRRRPPKPPKEPKPRKPRAKKVRWWCAKPPRAGLIFSDESLN